MSTNAGASRFCGFAGSDPRQGKLRLLASLIETRELHDVNPHAYLSDVHLAQ